MNLFVRGQKVFITFGCMPCDRSAVKGVFSHVQRVPFLAYDHLHDIDLIEGRRDLLWRAGGRADNFPVRRRFAV